MKVKRHINNPIITTTDVKPSHPGFHVDCVFNAAATEYEGETILLLRVAESVKSTDENEMKFPLLEVNEKNEYELTVKTLHKINDADTYDFSDTRVIFNRKKVHKRFT